MAKRLNLYLKRNKKKNSSSQPRNVHANMCPYLDRTKIIKDLGPKANHYLMATFQWNDSKPLLGKWLFNHLGIIWAIYFKSLTWIVRPCWGRIPLLFTIFSGDRSRRFGRYKLPRERPSWEIQSLVRIHHVSKVTGAISITHLANGTLK